MIAVEFAGVSKSFYRHTGREVLRKHIQKWVRRDHKERFWVLNDISFRIAAGDGIAIVGPNGAGKSTLLSLLTGLAEPDAGRILVNGRIGALLQLGAGFHPDLTGLENVRLNASLLGMTRRRTAELLERIVDFSGVGDFINEPLRTYSSGMSVRLAFAVAVHMEPDILVIDEVIAVGDHEFQAKCLQKVMELKAGGKTLVCVSHAGALLEKFCEHALWLDHGHVVMQGGVAEVVAKYEGRA